MAYNFQTPFGNLRQGSWGILPELGLTEQAAQKVSGGQSTDLSNAFTGNYQQPLISPLSSSGVVGTNRPPQPQPVFQVPVQPTPQPQTQSEGNFMDFYQGWNPDQARQDFASAFGNDINRLKIARGFSVDGNGNTTSQAALDAIYNPLMSTIQGQRDYINQTSLPNALSQLTTAKAQSERMVDEQYQKGQETLTRNQIALDRQKESAFDQARRDFQAMQQQSQARFGGRGSAGMAATEIAQKEFARQAGLGNISYTEGVQKLQDYASQLDRYSFEQKRKIDEDSVIQEQQIRQNAQTQLMAILSDETAIKSAKAGSAFALLQQYDTQLKNQASTRQQLLWQLEIWKQQQNDLLTKNFDLLKAPDLNFNSFNTSTGVAQAQNTPTYSYIPGIGNTTSEYDELENIFS